MSKFLSRFAEDETGATAIEYSIVVSLIAMVVITAFASLGSSLNSKVSKISNSPAWQ